MHRQYDGQRGTIVALVENVYAHTLDKYTVRLDGSNLDVDVWDIELRSMNGE